MFNFFQTLFKIFEQMFKAFYMTLIVKFYFILVIQISIPAWFKGSIRFFGIIQTIPFMGGKEILRMWSGKSGQEPKSRYTISY